MKGYEADQSGLDTFWKREIDPGGIELDKMSDLSRMEASRKILQVLLANPDFREHCHPLFSPFTNKIMIDSDLTAFKEDRVEIHLTKGSKAMLGRLTRPVWNFDKEEKVLVSVAGHHPLWPDQVQHLLPEKTLALPLKMYDVDVQQVMPKVAHARLLFVSQDGKEDKKIQEAVLRSNLRQETRNRLSQGFDHFKLEYLKYKKWNRPGDENLCKEMLFALSRLGFQSMLEFYDHLLVKTSTAATLSANVFAILDASVPEPAPNATKSAACTLHNKHGMDSTCQKLQMQTQGIQHSMQTL